MQVFPANFLDFLLLFSDVCLWYDFLALKTHFYAFCKGCFAHFFTIFSDKKHVFTLPLASRAERYLPIRGKGDRYFAVGVGPVHRDVTLRQAVDHLM